MELERIFDCFTCPPGSTWLRDNIYSSLPENYKQQFMIILKTKYQSIDGTITLTAQSLRECIDLFINMNPQASPFIFDGENSVMGKLVKKLTPCCPSTLQEIFDHIEQTKQRVLTIMESLAQEDPCKKFLEQILLKTDTAMASLKTFFQSISNYNPNRSCVDLVLTAVKEKSFTEVSNQWEHVITFASFLMQI